MKTITFYIALLVLFFTTGLSNAAVIDQAQLSSSGSIAFWEDERAVAETFTPGISGILDSIMLDIGISEPENLPEGFEMHVAIAEWSDSTPGATLGSVDLMADSSYVFGEDDYIDFLAESINLTSGSLYSIILTSDESYVEPAFPHGYFNTGVRTNWEGDAYSDGTMWTMISGDWVEWPTDSEADLYFATYMEEREEIPEPATLLLLSLGLLGLSFTRRRR